MIEEFKTIGSFAGLLTAVILIYDRLVKARPIASVTITERGTTKYACISIVSFQSPSRLSIVFVLCSPLIVPVFGTVIPYANHGEV